MYNIDELENFSLDKMHFHCLTFGKLLHEEFYLNRRVRDEAYKYGTAMICIRRIDGKPVRAEIFKGIYNG